MNNSEKNSIIREEADETIEQARSKNILAKRLAEAEKYYKPKKVSLWERIKGHKVFYLMLFPCLLSYFIFSYIPMSGLVLAFKEYGFNTGMFGGKWVALKYFKEFFNDPRCIDYFRNTLVVSCLKIFVYLPFPIILALMFNNIKRDRARGVFQSISYLPYFLSWVIVIGLIQRMLAPNDGLINQLIASMGGDGSRFFLNERGTFYPLVFGSYLWKNIGWDSIIYFSAIMGIAPSLYEAAAIDGANHWQQTRHITLPGISGTILILFILSLGGILTSGFDQIFLLKMPGNYKVSETIDTYVVRVGLQGGQFGYGTAVGLIQGIIGLLATVGVNQLSKKISENSLW